MGMGLRFEKPATRTMGFVHLGNEIWSKFGLENGIRPTPSSEPCNQTGTLHSDTDCIWSVKS